MTKNALTSPAAPDGIALRQLAKEINAHHDAFKIYVERMRRDSFECLSSAALAGKALIAAKSRVPYGYWIKWVEENCPHIDNHKSAALMRLANNWEKNSALKECDTLSMAMLLCAGQRAKNNATSQSWPPFLEAVNRFERLTKFVDAHPVADWPSDGVVQLRERVEPLARSLWPEKFV